MKRILTSTAVIAMFAAPALAGEAKMDTKAKADEAARTHEAESIHPPTNRVGEKVPEMTEQDKDAQPPTGRIGEVVPKMTAGEGGEKMSDAETPDDTKPSKN